MEKKYSKIQKDKIAAKCKDSWKDPTKRVEQKKRAAAKKLIKGVIPNRIDSSNPLNIENARQAIINEIKNLDNQMGQLEPLVQKRDKLSTILEVLNGLR